MGADTRTASVSESGELPDPTQNAECKPLLHTRDNHNIEPEDARSAMQPPTPVNVQRTQESTIKDLKGKGYRTDLGDCCAEPGGLKLCEMCLVCYASFSCALSNVVVHHRLLRILVCPLPIWPECRSPRACQMVRWSGRGTSTILKMQHSFI